MKKILSVMAALALCCSVFAQGVHLYKNGGRITINANEVDSLVYFPGYEPGQSIFEYIDQTIQKALNTNIWEIGDDGFWYKNGEKTNFCALGQKGEKGERGLDGEPGMSALEIWLRYGEVNDYNRDGDIDEYDFLLSLKGEKGDMGDKGDPGEKGDPGSDGEPGMSAYDIWMRYGETSDYDGDGDIDEEDFLLSLMGYKGDKGEPGNPGEKGEPGMSAYDIWMATGLGADIDGDGYIDEMDFLFWLKQ